MIFYLKPIFHRNVYVVDTVYKVGFTLIILGYSIEPTVEVSTPKGHMHK